MNSCCVVCGGRLVAERVTCRIRPYEGKSLASERCCDCGFISLLSNKGSYKEQLDDPYEKVNFSLRTANEGRPGREYYMAMMGSEILGKTNLTTSFFGVGLNKDYLWYLRSNPMASVKLVDIENMQQVSNFEPVNGASSSDLVIACEVIEHFEEPRRDFKKLLDIVNENGILICSSNIYDGSNIENHVYPFCPGHVAYWTPLSLISVASENKFFVDFRTPKMAVNRGGPRKKYIIFYRTPETFFRVSNYFGRHMYAPSEA